MQFFLCSTYLHTTPLLRYKCILSICLSVDVLQMYNYFEDDTYIYFILELCTNGEVYRYLKTSGRRLKESEGTYVHMYRFVSVCVCLSVHVSMTLLHTYLRTYVTLYINIYTTVYVHTYMNTYTGSFSS